MTIVEMHVAVDRGLQKIGSNAFEGFQSEEIDAYLNDAITKYMKAQAEILRNGGEGAKSAHENLRSIIKNDEITPLSAHSLPNSFVGTLPADFYIYLAAQVENAAGNMVRAEYVVPTEFYRSLPSAANSPIFRELPLTFFENEAVVAKDDITAIVDNPSSIHIAFMRTPAIVLRDDVTPANNVNCDLPAHTHQEIIDLCVAIMVEDLYQSGPTRDDPKPTRRERN